MVTLTLKDTQYLNRPKERAVIRVFQAMNSMSPAPETEKMCVCACVCVWAGVCVCVYVCRGNRILVNRLVFLSERL